jgi:ABC-type transporter Mla maintaining outer membrane lipid asymmetry ATPase subunit MlaF
VTPLVELLSVIKNYQGLRPLRVTSLTIGAHDQVALTGLDQVAAQVLADLITGATLPDAGTITVFGRPTSSLTDGADWLSLIERIGIVSERAVLLDGLTVIQNLAMPFSLDIEPPSPELRGRAAALAAEVGLPRDAWDQPGRLARRRRPSSGPARSRARIGSGTPPVGASISDVAARSGTSRWRQRSGRSCAPGTWHHCR